MGRFRRLTVRYERREDIHLAFTTLAAALIGLKQITQSTDRAEPPRTLS
jgi:hypothetical protein